MTKHAENPFESVPEGKDSQPGTRPSTLFGFYLIGEEDNANTELLAECIKTMNQQGIQFGMSLDVYMVKGLLAMVAFFREQPEIMMELLFTDDGEEGKGTPLTVATVVHFLSCIKTMDSIPDAIRLTMLAFRTIAIEMQGDEVNNDHGFKGTIFINESKGKEGSND